MTSPFHELEIVSGGLQYLTRKARTVAYSLNLDGVSKFLMMTRKGRYFLQFDTFYDGPENRMIPISSEDAVSCFNRLEEHEMSVREAFPNLKTKSA